MSKRFIIFGALILAASATAIFFLREPDPQAVLRQAARNLMAEKTFRIDMQATLVGLPKEFGGIVSNATGADIVLRSDIDRADPMKQASVSTFELHQGLATGGQTKLAGEARRKDGLHYVRLQTVEGVEGVEAERVIGRWMKSERSFLSLLLADGDAAGSLDAAGLEAMAVSIRNLDLLTVVRKLSKETVNGAKAYHYSVGLNMQAVSALLLKQRELRTGVNVNEQDILAVTNELLQWGQPVGEVWVGVRDRKLKKITLGTALGQEGRGGAAAATFAFSNEGKPVAVEVPQAEDIDKVLGPLFDKRLNLAGGRSAASAAKEEEKKTVLPTAPGAASQEADADMDGLSDQEEFFYGSDPSKPDTDGDGYPDGVEIENGMNPVGPGPLFGFGL